MRLDKFLKVSRLIKRRTLAKQVADQGRISIDGKVVKAASRVKVGDTLAIRFGQKIVTVQIDMLKDIVRKDEAATMYKIISEEKLEVVEPEFIDDED